MTKSRRRETPRKETQHSLAQKAIADRMKRAIETKGEASPEAIATAEALLEKTRIDQVRDLTTIGDLEDAVKTVTKKPFLQGIDYFTDFKALREHYDPIHAYRNQIAERKEFLERKQRRSAAD